MWQCGMAKLFFDMVGLFVNSVTLTNIKHFQFSPGDCSKRRARSSTFIERSLRRDVRVSISLTTAISSDTQHDLSREEFHHHIPCTYRFCQPLSAILDFEFPRTPELEGKEMRGRSCSLTLFLGGVGVCISRRFDFGKTFVSIPIVTNTYFVVYKNTFMKVIKITQSTFKRTFFSKRDNS
jgi:hypothetical protein